MTPERLEIARYKNPGVDDETLEDIAAGLTDEQIREALLEMAKTQNDSRQKSARREMGAGWSPVTGGEDPWDLEL